jgi:RNA polymerase sigma-70 factor (ECF subfamily)
VAHSELSFQSFAREPIFRVRAELAESVSVCLASRVTQFSTLTELIWKRTNVREIAPMVTAHRAHLSVLPGGNALQWSDRELVTALLAGDPRAAAQTWRKYAPRVFGLLERTLGLAQEAEDITQDIFLRVFSKVHTLRDPDAFGSFVLSVALRVIKWQLRRRRVRKILHLMEEVPDKPIPGLDIEARVTLRRFYDVLDTLPADERFVFALRHVEGMTLPEIAELSGVSLSTAKRRLGKATLRVRKKTQCDPTLSDYRPRITLDGE